MARKSLFRKSLNKSLLNQKRYKNKSRKLTTETKKKIEQVFNSPVKPHPKYKHLSKKALQRIEASKLVMREEEQQRVFRERQSIAKTDIQIKKKLRKTPPLSNIRLIHAGKKAKNRVKNIKQIREERLSKYRTKPSN